MTKSSDSSLVSVRKSSCAPGRVTREREITQLPSAHGPCRCHPGLPRNKYLVSSWQGRARVGRAARARRQRCWRRALVPGWGQMCCLLRAGARNCLFRTVGVVWRWGEWFLWGHASAGKLYLPSALSAANESLVPPSV